MAETLNSRPDQNLRTAVGAAVVLHLALLVLLSVQWSRGERRFDNPPMEVDLIADTGPVSTAPEISETPPAAKLGEEDALSREAPSAPPEPPATVATPAKSAAAKPPPSKAPPAKGPPARRPNTPTGRLDGIAEGLGKEATKAPGRGVPAAQTAAEVRRSIDVAIDGKILPFWRRNVPSGVDIDQLRVVIEIRLNQNGSIADIRQKGELAGKTDSNAPQQALFVERAIRSVRQAAPFDLPAEYYDQWRVWDVTFRARGI